MTEMNYLSTENVLLSEEDTRQYIELRISHMEATGVPPDEILNLLLDDDDWIGEMKDKMIILAKRLKY